MEEIKEVLLVVNPISGDIDKEEIIEEIEIAVKKGKAVLKMFKTTGKDDLIHLRNLLKNYKPDRIIAAGGDGTIKLVADAVKNDDIPIAIIPAGSANGLAFNLQIPVVLKDQLDLALGPACRYIDVLEINGEICLHMGDLGINAELIKNYESSSIRGKFGYLLQTIPTIIKSKYPFDFIIETDTKTISRKGILLAFTNFNKYGTGVNINPKGKPDDGIFEIIVFKNFDVLKIISTLRKEENLDPDFAEIIPAKKAVIKCKQPVSFQIDGEYLGETEEIFIKIHPKKLRVFCNIGQIT